MDWIAPVMGLIGVVVGAGIQEFRIWRERKDKYKDMVFEKRLDVHQSANYWCMKLSRLMSPHRIMEDGAIAVVIKEVREASEWLAKNELYLDEESSLKMTEFLKYVCETCLKYSEDKKVGKNINVAEETRKLLDNTIALFSSIRRGIGVKYLPEQRISIENVEVEKSLDKVVEHMEEFMKKQKR